MDSINIMDGPLYTASYYNHVSITLPLCPAASGQIEFNEFCEMMARHMHDSNENKEDFLRDAFRKFDQDGNGRITADELRKV